MKYLILWSIFATWITSCGIDRSRHFDVEKTFGREKSPDLTDHQPELPAPPSPTPSPIPSPTAAPVIINPPVPDEDDIEEPAPTYDALLGHFGFAGYFDPKSARRILEGEGEGVLAEPSLLDTILRGIIKKITNDNTNESLDVLTAESGIGRQVVTQSVTTANGDYLGSIAGSADESQSGKQTLHWVLGETINGCPKPFICVDRITWEPNKGNIWTFCFRNPEKRSQAMAVPFAPNSQFDPQSFRDAIPGGTLQGQPFLISKHEGIVECNAKDIVTVDIDKAQWLILQGDLSASRQPGFLKVATVQPLVPDSEITIKYAPWNPDLGRTWQPNHAPFMDQMSRFSTSTKYFIDSREGVFAKIIKTTQSPLSIPFLNAVGLQIDYNFEFCTHKNTDLVPNPVNHCAAVRR